MRICVIYPSAHGVHTGNLESAGQWGAELQAAGHGVRVAEDEATGCCDALVVLHAIHGRKAMGSFRERQPDGRIVAVLTGTDLYGEGGAELEETMRKADRLVVLQPKALERVPAGFRDKTRVIFQGAAPMVGPVPAKSRDPFQVCVVGHLRDVKDPLRTAEAARLLPPESRLVVKHAGAILDFDFVERVREEEETNPRYEWRKELPEAEVRRLMAESQCMVISSRQEGGARVVGESIVEGTPVIAARSEGVMGVLGEDYGGYFPPGDTAKLAELLERAESDETFLAGLQKQCDRLAPQFDPARETKAWKELIGELETPGNG